VQRLQMFAQRVAANRHAMLDHQLRLAQVERVARDRMRVIRQPHAQIGVQLGHDRCRQRALHIERGLLRGDAALQARAIRMSGRIAAAQRSRLGGYRRKRFFRTCRGKHMFSGLVLARHKAMYQRRLMADLGEKRGELFRVFLMR
jgi:hypothetical protein